MINLIDESGKNVQIEMLELLIKRKEINIHGQVFRYVSNGQYSATYSSSKGTEYTIIPCEESVVKNRPNAKVYYIQNLKGRAKQGKSFAIDGNRVFDC